MNCGTAWLLKKSSSLGVRPSRGEHAAGAPPRGLGSVCAKHHVAVSNAARHIPLRVTLKSFDLFIHTPSNHCLACFSEQKLSSTVSISLLRTDSWIGFLWSRGES